MLDFSITCQPCDKYTIMVILAHICSPRGKSIGQDEDEYISAAIEAMSELKDFQ